MLRIYDTIGSYLGEIKKRFNKEFCDQNLTQDEYNELNSIYNRLEELAQKCKNKKENSE